MNECLLKGVLGSITLYPVTLSAPELRESVKGDIRLLCLF